MLTAESPNQLYFGDCLDVMREELPSNSIDLIYLDPPSTPSASTTSSLMRKRELPKRLPLTTLGNGMRP